LSFYNNTKDIELLLAPVLYKLNQQYQLNLDTQLSDELTNLILNNKERINKDELWDQLSTVEGSVALCPHIDNLSKNEKNLLLKQLKDLLKELVDGNSRDEIRNFLAANLKAKELLADLSARVRSDKNSPQRTVNISELKGMTEVLCLSLIEDDHVVFSPHGTQIYLRRKTGYWEVTCADDVSEILNTNPQMLKASLYKATDVNAIPIASPTPVQLELMKQPRILITQNRIDNPGRGNCAFYAFAIGLIDIIQEEKISSKQSLFDRWLSQDSTLVKEYEAICAFDYKNPNNALLDKLQRSLRNIVYNYQLNEITQACIKVTAVDDKEKLDPDETSKAYKDAMKRKYQKLTASDSYINFAALYYGNAVDTGSGFNPFVNSAAIRKTLEELDRSQIEDNYEELVLVPLFIKLIYGEEQASKPITQTTAPVVTSPILAAINNVTQEFFWGTHQDLSYLANLFKVNLHTLENGEDRRHDSLGDVPERHTITVSNEGNSHWTTEIAKAHSLKFKDQPDQPENTEKGTLKSALKVPKPVIQDKDVLAAADRKKSSSLPLAKRPKDVNVQQKTAQKTAGESTGTGYKRKVKFKFTDSQLAAQPKAAAQPEENEKDQAMEKSSRKLLDDASAPSLKQPVKSAPKVDSNDAEKLTRLRRVVQNATTAYTGYSESIWFSLFHRHGSTGRVRAKAFNTDFAKYNNYDEAKRELINYLLNDKNNGNTYPHSFRTMLLREMLKKNDKTTLQYISDNFNELLKGLSSELRVNADTSGLGR
jgi:hypothetical protein